METTFRTEVRVSLLSGSSVSCLFFNVCVSVFACVGVCSRYTDNNKPYPLLTSCQKQDGCMKHPQLFFVSVHSWFMMMSICFGNCVFLNEAERTHNYIPYRNAKYLFTSVTRQCGLKWLRSLAVLTGSQSCVSIEVNLISPQAIK